MSTPPEAPIPTYEAEPNYVATVPVGWFPPVSIDGAPGTTTICMGYTLEPA